MEIYPDFDASEVARTVALAVSNLHNRPLSSDSCTDETPLVCDKANAMNPSTNQIQEDKEHLLKREKQKCLGNSLFKRIPARYVLTCLGFLGFCNVYALRVNLSVALVAMVKPNNSDHKNYTDECPVHNDSNSNDTSHEGEFDWKPDLQATILASFFYGYVVTQIPGGRLAEIFGGKWLLGIGVLCTSVLSLLTPVAARWHVNALIAVRILEGLGEGVTYPAMHSMLGRWMPKFERSLLSTIIYSGSQVGTVVAMPISGLLSDSKILGGWPSVFYFFGILGCLWFVFWALLIYETPEEHPRISVEELQLIRSGVVNENETKVKQPIPWSSILTSAPVWALVFTHFGQNWGFYTLLTELPTFFSTVLHTNLTSTGFLSALPYLLQALVSCPVSYCADYIRVKRIFSGNTIRKICNTVGFVMPAICFFGVTMSGCNNFLGVMFLSLAMGFNGFTYAGFLVTHVDMSPEFSGTLMGMTNCVGNFAGFLAPEVVGVLTKTNPSLHQWHIVFYIAICVYILMASIFVIFGSARLQPWDPSYQKKSSSQASSRKKHHDSDVEGDS